MKEVWKAYKNTSPTEGWTTRKSSCGLMYERSNDELVYADNTVSGISQGQILFMDLKLLRGIYHLATSFEITLVEDELGVIEISYTESGINEGKQVIKMAENDRGYTQIQHMSIIRSGSVFRDRVLYPYFHNKLINAFHRKMKRIVDSGDYLAHEE